MVKSVGLVTQWPKVFPSRVCSTRLAVTRRTDQSGSMISSTPSLVATGVSMSWISSWSMATGICSMSDSLSSSRGVGDLTIGVVRKLSIRHPRGHEGYLTVVACRLCGSAQVSGEDKFPQRPPFWSVRP